jgi:chromosome segregation ATPase
VQIVPMPGTSQKSSAPGTVRTTGSPRKPLRAIPPRSASNGSESSDCSQHSDTIRRLKNAQRNVDSLRAAIDRIGDDPVMSSRTSCTTRGERLDACRDGSYNRERELERTRERLQAAEDELADAEGELRAAGVSPGCVGD